MITSLIIYGLMIWMWVNKMASLQLILGVVTAKFIITIIWVYSIKIKGILKRHKRNPPPNDE